MEEYRLPIDFEELSAQIHRQAACEKIGHPNSRLIGNPAINVEIYECLDCRTTYTVRMSITTVIRRVRNREHRDSGLLEAVRG